MLYLLPYFRELVLLAIQALKEALEHGNVKRPGGWLNRAIQDGSMPNETTLPIDKVERDIFKQWFDLAYKQRLVLPSTSCDNGRMYVFTVDGLRLSFEQMLAEYPQRKTLGNTVKNINSVKPLSKKPCERCERNR